MPSGFSTVAGAGAPPSQSADGFITTDDFWSYPPSRSYIYMPCREPWSAESVNNVLSPVTLYDAAGQPLKHNGKLVKIKPALWLDQNRRVEQLTWAPGLPEIIENKHIVDGGWFERVGGRCLNLYRPPRLALGDASKGSRWIEHVHKVYDADEARHIINWLAQRVQQPNVKPNHALVLAGPQGVGKDTILEPVKHAVGNWNFREISPANLFEPFNEYVRSVILRISEGHDLGDNNRANRFAFYERTKVYAAAPPDVLRCNDKHLRAISLPNVLGLILTSNHKTDGIYVTNTDRRHFIAWSPRSIGDFNETYWNELWHWYKHEDGFGHVAAYLTTLDISGFNPNAPPPKTAAFWEVLNANQAPEDMELADVFDDLGWPEAVTIVDLVSTPAAAALEWLLEHKSKRSMPYRLERCGYVSCRNPNTDDGRWKVGGKNQTIYVKGEPPATSAI
jgi:Family of unknown function (DUF5906)